MVKKKTKLPEAALEFFRKKGAKGGKAKVSKGFGKMGPEKLEIVKKRAAEGRAKAAKAKAKKEKA